MTEKLRASTTVDWQVRDKLRYLVHRWKYPLDGANDALDLCMKQAEPLSEHWSRAAEG